MKIRKFIGLIAPVLAMMLMSGCKTSEDNYRAAYEVAWQHQQDGVDDDTYSLMKAEEMPQAVTVGADTLRMKTEIVALYVDKQSGAGEKMYPYNVVVGQFRQVFNAKAMRDRLKSYGYSPYIVATREPVYYVIASGCRGKDEAAALIKRMEDDEKVVMKMPFPWVLVPVEFSE